MIIMHTENAARGVVLLGVTVAGCRTPTTCVKTARCEQLELDYSSTHKDVRSYLTVYKSLVVADLWAAVV